MKNIGEEMITQNLTSSVPCAMPKVGPVFGLYLKANVFVDSKIKITFLFLSNRVNKGCLVNLDFKVKEVTEEHKVIKDRVESLV